MSWHKSISQRKIWNGLYFGSQNKHAQAGFVFCAHRTGHQAAGHSCGPFFKQVCVQHTKGLHQVVCTALWKTWKRLIFKLIINI